MPGTSRRPSALPLRLRSGQAANCDGNGDRDDAAILLGLHVGGEHIIANLARH
jgi:hypothetical protein